MSATQLGADEPATPSGMPAGDEEETPAVVADDEQPRPKPYADAKGVFAKLIKLLPLATDEEAATFERRARRFTRRLGPLSLGRLVDDRKRPILWYACDSDDHAALEILLDQGCALSAFVPSDDGPSPYEHAHRLGHALCGNQPVRRVLGDDAAVLARSSGEEPASPRYQAGGASMAWRTTR